jgi:RNA polymerase sigma-70 factor (ECF subfamily)
MSPDKHNTPPEEARDSQTDLQLVRKVRHGDRPAFDLLVIKYQSRGDSAFYTWLYRIAVNTAKNFLEARGRRPQGSADVYEAENYEDGSRLRDGASPERMLQRDQLRQALGRAIDELPEDLRSAFLLREYDGLSYEDIARILECPIGTVRSRIFRARDAVDRHLGPLLNDSPA